MPTVSGASPRPAPAIRLAKHPDSERFYQIAPVRGIRMQVGRRLYAFHRQFAGLRKQRRVRRLAFDGAPNHRCSDLVVPDNISLLFLPPYAPELNPKENLWDEIREKIFKNDALKSIDAVRAKLKQAILYIERNPKTVQSITSFPYIVKSP
jgi:transposase